MLGDEAYNNYFLTNKSHNAIQADYQVTEQSANTKPRQRHNALSDNGTQRKYQDASFIWLWSTNNNSATLP